jgi:hypothetical protein
MKLALLLALYAVLSGCAGYVHSKDCLPSRDGYQWCHHYIEYWDETKCSGSCAVK